MKFSARSESKLQIDLTALIDVVFLLLIFFMVSTTFSRESQLRIKLPEASQTEEKENKEDKVLEINISAAGNYSVRIPGSDKARTLVSDTREVLQRAIAAGTAGIDKIIIVVRADRKTPHEAVIRAMDASRRLGHTRITFATQRPGSGNTTP